MSNMTKGGRGRNARPRRRFSEEFKAEAVRLVIEEERPIRQVARELDVVPSALTRWVTKEETRRGITRDPAGPTGLNIDEREELERLRKRVRELEVDKAILKKAAAYSTGQRNTTTSDTWLRKVVKHAGSQTRLGGKRES